MLRCLFGKCSSETYVVNRSYKPGGDQTENYRNGGPKIIPVLVESDSPASVDQLNNRNIETNRPDPVTSQPTVRHNEKSIPSDNEEAKTIAPTPNQISSQKNDSHENSEKGKNDRNTLLQKDDIKGTDISVAPNRRPQAPQPPAVKADIHSTILTSESVPKEQHEPISKETVQGNSIANVSLLKSNQDNIEKQETSTIIIKTQDHIIGNNTGVDRVSSTHVINSSQDNKKEEKDTKTQNYIINDQKSVDNIGDHVTNTPVLNSSQDKNKKREEDAVITNTQTHVINDQKSIDIIAHVASTPVLNSSQNKNEKKEENAVITNTQGHVINDQKLIDNIGGHVASEPVLNSSQDKNKKNEDAVITKTQDHIVNDQQSTDNIGHIISTPILSSSQDKNKKKEEDAVITKTQDHVINDQKSVDNTRGHVDSAPVLNASQDKNKKNEKGETQEQIIDDQKSVNNTRQEESIEAVSEPIKRRSGVVPLPVKYDETKDTALPHYPKDPDDEVLIKSAIENNDFLNKILSGKRLEDVVQSMYNREIASKETIIKQGEKGSHMYISAKGKYQVIVKGKVVSEFDDVRVFGELAILYNAKRLATIKALTPGRVWVLDRSIYQQIMLRYNIKEQDEIMLFLMKNKILNVVGETVLQEVANLLKPEFFQPGKQIVRQGDKGDKFYIIRAGTVTITKAGEGEVGIYKKGDCFGELALLKEDSRQATVTANAPGVECLTLTRKEFIDYFGEVGEITNIKPRSQNSIKDAVAEYEDVELPDLKIIKTLGIGGFGRVELVQHIKKKDLVFALKYLKKIDIVMQHQQDHVYNEKIIQMTSKSPFIIRLYRTYKDSKYIYFLMESCLGGDLWSLLQKQKLRRFDEKEARFIAACVLEAFDYLHSRGIVYRDLKPENLLISANGYIKLTDFGFAKKISARGRTYTFAGTPEYVAPEIVLNKGHDRAVDYWAFGAFIFELLTGRTPFRTDDSSHMKTYTKILNGIDNIQFPSYVNLKARHIVEKLCRPIAAERLGMQRGGIKDIKMHKWFLGWDWQKFAKCETSSPFKPKLKSPVDTQYFDQFKKDTDDPPQELSGWDANF